MSELIAFIARTLVDEPEEVEVREVDDTVELHVAPADLGKVIGRRGRTAKAMRSLLAAAGGDGPRRLDIVEPSERDPE